MPETAANNNPQIQSYQEAADALRDRIYGPVFFSKLAHDFGIQPADQEEAQLLLAMAQQLRVKQGQEYQKTAHERKSLLKSALHDLNQSMGGPGYTSSPLAADPQVKAAAAGVLQQYPDLRDAALLYRDYLAQVAAQTAAN